MLGCGHISHVVKNHLKIFSTLGHGTDKLSMTKKGSTIIVNFMTSLGRCSCATVLGGDKRWVVKIMYSFDDVHIDCYCINRL